MILHIPEFRANAVCNQHLNHGAFDIDLGPDVVKVVRCKECKYRTKFGHCGHPRQHGILPTAYPYDFCSYGERKDEANES